VLQPVGPEGPGSAVSSEAGGHCRETGSLRARLPWPLTPGQEPVNPAARRALGGEGMRGASKGSTWGRMKAGQREVGEGSRMGKRWD